MRKLMLVLGVLLGVASGSQAVPITFGTIGSSGNSYPFGGGDFNTVSTRYQQVYRASNFPTGPLSINSITFFNSAGNFDNYRTGTYSFSLSTTTAPVNGLNTVNLTNNIGVDNQFITSAFLSGSMPLGAITFTGTPFVYDPSAGNLLLDITYTGSEPPNPYRGFFDAMNFGTFGIDSSRAHNYGSSFEGWGLVTQFDVSPAAIPEPVSCLVFGGLVGIGGLVARRRMKVAA